jgi:2-dehydropantoate 2-reductase
MKNYKIAVIGIGATGSVLAAALLKQDPDTICIDPRPGLADAVIKNGITISGEPEFRVPVINFFSDIQHAGNLHPDIILISTKTYHLSSVIKEIKEIFIPGIKIISAHNGLGTEDIIAEEFGKDSVLRMSLNLGASIKDNNHIHVNFFEKPNYIGSITDGNKNLAQEIAGLLTNSGLDTKPVDDIKLEVWRKMIGKCTNASICAVTDRTIKDVITNQFTREIAAGCYKEALAVAKAMGYDFGDNYLDEILIKMEKVGLHKDSMCYDVANKLPTEIDFLGGKIVEYGQAKGVLVPYFTVMTNLVRAMEKNYKNNS